MRFFTVPSAQAARTSVAWAMVLIGAFYLSTSFMGLGAATIVGKDHIGRRMYAGQAIAYIAHHPKQEQQLDGQLARKATSSRSPTAISPRRCWRRQLGGSLLTAFVAAVAFATILAVVAGPDDHRVFGLRTRHLV